MHTHISASRILIATSIILLSLRCAALQRVPNFSNIPPAELFDSAKVYLEQKSAPDSALMCLSTLTTLAESGSISDAKPHMLTIAYSAMGAIYASVYGNYSEAAICMMKGLDMAEQNHQNDWKVRIQYNLIALEYEQNILAGNEKTSSQTIERFSTLFHELNLKSDLDLACPLLLSVADLSIKERHTGVVTKIINSHPQRDSIPSEVRQLKSAMEHFESGDYHKAVVALNKLKSTLSKGNSVMSNINAVGTELIIGNMTLAMGNIEDALAIYNDIITKCRNNNDLFPIFEIYNNLKTYCLRHGDTASATKYELEELRLKSELIKRSNALSIEGAKALYNQDKLRSIIVAESARARTYRTVFWVSAAFLILVVTLLILLYHKLCQVNASKNIIARNDIDYFRHSANSASRNSVENSDLNASKSLFEKVQKVLSQSDEVYQEEFTIARLAQLVEDKPSAISAAISQATGESTSQFLARARIREACRRINDVETYGSFTIEAIGQSVGYRSRSHFGSVFKKIVGMSPSEYVTKVRINDPQ